MILLSKKLYLKAIMSYCQGLGKGENGEVSASGYGGCLSRVKKFDSGDSYITCEYTINH